MINNITLLDLKDFSLFEFFLSTKKKNKLEIKNGTALIGGEIKKTNRKSRFVTFISYVQQILDDYYNADIPETERLIWRAEKLNCMPSINKAQKTLDFSEIKNDKTRIIVQEFCKSKLAIITFESIYSHLLSIRHFLQWFEKEYSNLNLSDITREEMEEYYLWIRANGELSSHQINVDILNLKCFFDWGTLCDIEGMPTDPLILVNDYSLKHQKDSNYLTAQEMKGVISIIPYLPKLLGRMTFCLMYLGVRFCELSHLDIDVLKRNDDGTYYLDIEQYKTSKINGKPVLDILVPILLDQIKKTKERFGDEAKYVFVGDKNNVIRAQTFNNNINKLLIEHNILGRDGNILHVTTHRFRATVATNLISSGVEVDVAAQLLGQSSLSSLSHYATVTNDVVKEQLKPRLQKDDLLIRNIGKVKDISEVIPEHSVALCNGFCNKNPLTTPCAKANACLNCSMFVPSIQFLNGYYLQLQEIEATIKIAEVNGYVMMLKKARMEKESLEKIIAKLEEKGGKRNG